MLFKDGAKGGREFVGFKFWMGVESSRFSFIQGLGFMR